MHPIGKQRVVPVRAVRVSGCKSSKRVLPGEPNFYRFQPRAFSGLRLQDRQPRVELELKPHD
jgi:hypothetical protein